MKTAFIRLVFVCSTALSFVLNRDAAAQGFSIDSYRIAGGGGISTNGRYSVSGTIGQHDASATMAGCNYSLTAGFWSLIAAVQTPDAPTLTITMTGPNTVIVSWPSSVTDFCPATKFRPPERKLVELRRPDQR